MQRNGMEKTPIMNKNAPAHNLTGPYSPSPPVRTNFPDDDASNFQSIVQFRKFRRGTTYPSQKVLHHVLYSLEMSDILPFTLY
mgnify:FL=1